MMILVARAICGMALRCLPSTRRAWGRAMRAELDYIAAPDAALAFALGCLKVGVMQRLGDDRTLHLSGRAMVVIIGLICAAFHLGCAFSGVEVLRGARPDPIVTQLANSAAPSAAAAYRAVRPMLILLIALLGIAHLIVVWCIWRGRLRAFLAAWLTGTSLAVALIGCILVFARSTSGIALQLAGLMAQAAAVLWLIHPNLTASGNGRERRISR